jgi:hypothetical protein
LRTARRFPLIPAFAFLVAVGGCGSPQSVGAPPPETDPTPTSAKTTGGAPRPSDKASASATPIGKTARADSLTLVMNGDLLWHNMLWYSAKEDARRRGRSGYDFAPLLAGMRQVISKADVAICHEEPPIGPAGGPFANYPRFSVPPPVVRAIKQTGYDVCTTASNHSVDSGFAGLRRTLDALDRAGIAHAGTARTAAEARRPTIFTASNGVKVGVVSGTFSLNGLPMPAGKP